MPYSVITPFPAPAPATAKPRRLVPSRAVPASFVVPSHPRERVADRWLRALSTGFDEFCAFLAPPAPRARLHPVFTSSADAGRFAREQGGFEDRARESRSFGDRASAGGARSEAAWGEQIALIAGLLAAIALAWFLG